MGVRTMRVEVLAFVVMTVAFVGPQVVDAADCQLCGLACPTDCFMCLTECYKANYTYYLDEDDEDACAERDCWGECQDSGECAVLPLPQRLSWQGVARAEIARLAATLSKYNMCAYDTTKGPSCNGGDSNCTPKSLENCADDKDCNCKDYAEQLYRQEKKVQTTSGQVLRRPKRPLRRKCPGQSRTRMYFAEACDDSTDSCPEYTCPSNGKCTSRCSSDLTPCSRKCMRKACCECGQCSGGCFSEQASLLEEAHHNRTKPADLLLSLLAQQSKSTAKAGWTCW